MEETRLTLLPDRRLSVHASVLAERLKSIAEGITADNFASLLDGTMRYLLQAAFDNAEADEGSVWLVNESLAALVLAYNTGPNSDKLVGRFRQPLTAGHISMVFANEQSFIENEVYKTAAHDKSLDRLLEVQTNAMIAVPFYFFEACRGVVSCVQLIGSSYGNPNGRRFDNSDERAIRNAAVALGRLLEHRIMRVTLGLE
jgi:hypothetical protein